jgi:hypothetical protein
MRPNGSGIFLREAARKTPRGSSAAMPQVHPEKRIVCKKILQSA